MYRGVIPEHQADERSDESGTLDGADVLPGFVLVLAELFAELDEQG